MRALVVASLIVRFSQSAWPFGQSDTVLSTRSVPLMIDSSQSWARTMCKLPTPIAMVCMLVVGLSAPLSAQSARDWEPCGQITAACRDAGFTSGTARVGTGLRVDCIVPIMQGKAQPRATIPLPKVDPQLVADCKAANPRFGKERVPPSDVQLPASEFSPPTTAGREQPSHAAGSGSLCASADDATPNGLVVVLPSTGRGDRSQDLQAINNPFISGVAVQINWRDLEPVQGTPDWSKLDDVLLAAESSNKWVQLLIFPGFFSPAWALEGGVETDLFPIQYGPGRGTIAKLPMPWDSVYLDRWFAFLRQLSERYGGSPSFRIIAADGPTSVSAEMTLPIKPHDSMKKWLDHGYTPSKYLAAWERVFQVYAEGFPNQCVSLSAPGLPILERGRIGDHSAHMRAREAIIDRAKSAFGRRFVIQWSDLHAGQARVEAPDQTDSVIDYSGRIITGLQMRTSAENASAVMGAEGNPPAALRASLDKGMQANSSGQHVNYLEIYEPDVLAGEMQPALEYGASLFARK